MSGTATMERAGLCVECLVRDAVLSGHCGICVAATLHAIRRRLSEEQPPLPAPAEWLDEAIEIGDAVAEVAPCSPAWRAWVPPAAPEQGVLVDLPLLHVRRAPLAEALECEGTALTAIAERHDVPPQTLWYWWRKATHDRPRPHRGAKKRRSTERLNQVLKTYATGVMEALG